MDALPQLQGAYYYRLVFTCKKILKPLFSVPVIPPQNVTAVSRTSTSIFITWEAVSSNQLNSNMGYKVTWVLQGKRGDEKTSSVLQCVTMANLTGLKKSRNYNVTVFAFNECGDGPGSDILIVKTDEESK